MYTIRRFIAVAVLVAMGFPLAPGVPATASHLGRTAVDDEIDAPPTTAQLRVHLLYFEPPGGGLSVRSAQENVRRNVALAAGLSAAVPGLGQAYNRNWIRAAAAFAVEGGLVLGYVLWKHRGEEGEDAYTEYAHDHWNPARYAAWLNDYAEYLEEIDGASFQVDPISVPSNIDFSNPGSWNAQDRAAVRSLFDAVRSVEDVVYHPETGAAFSHNLPYFAEQQYYELIGKYYQFAPGWKDYPEWEVDGTYTGAIDPERTGADGGKPNVQGRFLEYARDHAHANDLLRRASRVSAFLVLNHMVAAFDAAISAKLHNDRVATDVRFSHDLFDRPQVKTSVTLRF